LFAGYRACLRCRPLDNPNARPDWMARLLETVQHSLNGRISGADLRAMGIDPSRARRQFLKDYGLTFQAYCRAHRLSSALDFIRKGGTLDDAVFESGYESHSGFRQSFQNTFGLPPGKAGALDCIQLAWMDTPVGPMIAGATGDGICLLEFTDRRMLERELENLRHRLSKPLVPGENPHHKRLEAELKEYFAGKRREFTLPLVQNGSEFEKNVWKELSRIPHGEVRSYEDIARSIGHPKAVRAVGRANGMNCIALLVPCHRVVRKNGDLGGYGGGVERKRFLLDLER
ncbi:MAG: methylated-DNA--[protein]-cysteine S-methyltransferase, partial [Acidobacteriota bacterium]|nr:methylated-DNA--[protein]-cysteine S-methyltransferase [Acidobacteriota bacterium]